MISNSQRLAQIEIGSELGQFECVAMASRPDEDVSEMAVRYRDFALSDWCLLSLGYFRTGMV